MTYDMKYLYVGIVALLILVAAASIYAFNGYSDASSASEPAATSVVAEIPSKPTCGCGSTGSCGCSESGTCGCSKTVGSGCGCGGACKAAAGQ
jgi:hypothetical protein